MPKAYDERYFRRWYQGSRAVSSAAELDRRARLALAAAEYVLERAARTALDVGCGEGRWRGALRRVRRGLAYTGVDPSEYVVRRHGRRRGIRLGTLGDLADLRLRGPFDLIVCSDVVHYVPGAELERGLRALRALAGGVLWVDAFTTDDDFVGDRVGWQPRAAPAYRKAFRAAGFLPLGPGLWLPARHAGRLAALERPR